jgi:hypothetical protein
MEKEEKKSIDLGVTLYDLNKQAMAKEPPLDVIAFNIKMVEVVKKLATKKYWMLLNNETRSYTVFIIDHPENTRKITDEVSITLHNRGEILSIEEQEDGNFEIWVRDFNTREVFAYYLFDYKFGIITI